MLIVAFRREKDMAEKAAAPKKKAVAVKATAKKKTGAVKATAKKRVGKGESLVCQVCGLAVVVEEVGDIAIVEENVLLCCGKPMKGKAAKAKATKK
jgi:hypothetical protein